MKVLFLVLFFAAITDSAMAANTCTAFQKSGNAELAAKNRNLNAYSEGWNVFAQFCSGFGIVSTCNKIAPHLAGDAYNAAFSSAVNPLISEAIRAGDMSTKEANAFSDLVITLRNQHYSAKLSQDEANRITVEMNKQNCGKILTLLALSDSALLSSSSQGKTGKCKVAVKSGSTNVYKILVNGKTYPIEGVTYKGMPAVTTALREALDSSVCL